MKVVVESDAVRLFDAAHAALSAREVDNNVVLGTLLGVVRGVYATWPEPPWSWGVHEGAQLIGVAVRTPPMPMLVSTMSEHAAEAVADAIAQRALVPLDVNGPADITDVIAARVAQRAGARTERGMRMRLFQLTRVITPPKASGAMRLGRADEALELAALVEAFDAEAMPHEGIRRDRRAWVEAAIAQRSLLVWEDAGAVVALAHYGRQVGSGAAIGPVYTAPSARGRGYASSLVAALSQQLLDDGRSYTCLFTDLANPTSNRLYPRVGYEPVCDYQLWKLSRA